MISHKRSNKGISNSPADIVYTPIAIAKEIINRYKPSGRILDPCKGSGAFYNSMPGSDWCEITEGRKFL